MLSEYSTFCSINKWGKKIFDTSHCNQEIDHSHKIPYPLLQNATLEQNAILIRTPHFCQKRPYLAQKWANFDYNASLKPLEFNSTQSFYRRGYGILKGNNPILELLTASPAGTQYVFRKVKIFLEVLKVSLDERATKLRLFKHQR